VRVGYPELVLDEHQRVLRLAEVVVVGHGSGKERVSPDRTRCRVSERSHHQRVVEAAERLFLKKLESLVISVCQIEKTESCRDVESRFEELEGGKPE